MVQWLRLHAPNAGGPGLIPDQGTRSHMLQLRPGIAKQINIKKKKKTKKDWTGCSVEQGHQLGDCYRIWDRNLIYGYQFKGEAGIGYTNYYHIDDI